MFILYIGLKQNCVYRNLNKNIYYECKLRYQMFTQSNIINTQTNIKYLPIINIRHLFKQMVYFFRRFCFCYC